MALQVTSASFSLLRNNKTRKNIRTVAYEESATTQIEGEDKVKLGGSDLKVTKLGIESWSWGDAGYWNNFEWDDTKLKVAQTAFDTSVESGITFFDTAEVYGPKLSFGAVNSETLLERFIKERKQKDPGVEVMGATKFASLPLRLGRGSVI